MKNTFSGVFTPQTAQESVKFQKLAIALGYVWAKAGAKVIGLADNQSIRLKEDGRMTPVSDYDGDSNLTIAALTKAVTDAREGKVLTTRTALLSVYNKTKCREIEEGIKQLLQDNFDKDDNEDFVVPQELLDRAARELNDEQRAYFKAAGIVITHPNDKFGTVTQAFGVDAPANLRNVEVAQTIENTSVGTVVVDVNGNVYFASKA